QAIQVGYGFVHRVEALVQVQRAQPIDDLACLVLQALALADGTPAARPSLSDMQQRLGLPAAVVHQLLLALAQNGLLARTEGDSVCWRVTEAGRRALGARSYPVQAQERCVFPFLERLEPSGERREPPQFTAIAECVGVP